MSFCSQCGSGLTSGDAFCAACGKSTVELAPAATGGKGGTAVAMATPPPTSIGAIVNRYSFAALFVFIIIGFDLFALMLMSQFGDRASEYGGMSELIQKTLGHAAAFLWLAVICFAAAIVAVLRNAPPFLFWWSIVVGLIAQKLAAVFVNPTYSDMPQSFPIPMASAAAFWLLVAIVLAWPRIRLTRVALQSPENHEDVVHVQGASLWVMAGAALLLFVQTLMAIIAYLGWKDPNGQSIAFASSTAGVAGQIYSHLQFTGSLHIAASVAALAFLCVSVFLALRSEHHEILPWVMLFAGVVAQFVALANKLPMVSADAAPSDGSFPLGALALAAIFAAPLVSKQAWTRERLST